MWWRLLYSAAVRAFHYSRRLGGSTPIPLSAQVRRSGTGLTVGKFFPGLAGDAVSRSGQNSAMLLTCGGTS